MSHYKKTGISGTEDLLFLPLGGTGEIGMNLNLYGHQGKWLMVDLGISFADDYLPGVDIIMPDPSFIEERKDDLCGLILTHAHEDHLGAVAWLWERLECPVYATAFTAIILRNKLREAGLDGKVPIHIIELSGTFKVGPFDIELITLTHSIPEPNAVIIRTKCGVIVHTGDWKLDPDPLIGRTSDEKRLMALGREGVLAMICDSTNALSEGRSGSEGDVRRNLQTIINECERAVAVGCFASNLARVESIALAAESCGRQVCLVGRSLWRMTEAAREVGYLDSVAPFLKDIEAMGVAPHKILYICTGSQGEPKAALSRIARKDHPCVSLDKGDCVIFSSRKIPGNELAISRLQNRLAEIGCRILTEKDDHIHTSGHPNKDELRDMYSWVKPLISVPVHGETRHLIAHANLAEECGVPHRIIAHNGTMLSLGETGVEIIDEVFSGRLKIGRASCRERVYAPV